ncbi:MAG: serine hydrolase [Gemmatimonadaceae bacterium]|nr:serine hydrolase [Gemmatimonadaceae bacterium]
MRPTLTLLAAAQLLLSMPMSAQPLPRGVRDSLDRFLVRHLREIPVPGFSVVVVRGGTVAYSRGFGVEVAGGTRPMTTRSPVAIGSQTKSITAIAMMRLVERGLVRLDAPVVRYLPWFRTADRRGGEITVRMLLHNTSGIPSADKWLYSQDSDEGAMEREVRGLSSVILTRTPGTSFEYANENWSVAGAIIEAVSGMRYSAFLEQEFFHPLGMTRSSTSRARFADIGALWGHHAEPDGVSPAGPRFISGALAAGSELRMSADDMGKYLGMLLRKGATGGTRYLREESVAQLFVPGSITTVTMPEMGVRGGKSGYGMGWVVVSADGRTVINHGGSTVVMSSWTIIDTLTKTAASVLYGGPTLDAYRYPGQLWLVNNLLHITNGEPLSTLGRPTEADPTRNAYELPGALRDRYLGTYLSPDGFRAEVVGAPRGDRLQFRMDAGASRYRADLDFVSPSSAVLRNIAGAAPITFTITPAGVVTGLAGSVPGGVFRRRSAADVARVQERESPGGRVRIQVPRDWTVSFDGNAFTAVRTADPTTRLSGVLAPSRGGMPVALRLSTRSESIGRHEWTRRTWMERTPAGARQRTQLETQVGTDWFRLDADVAPGRLTAALRDVIVPLLSTIELR